MSRKSLRILLNSISLRLRGYLHKHNLISKIREDKYFKTMNEINGHRKCMVVLKFLENIERAVAPSLLPLVS